MTDRRKSFTAEFKPKVALEAIALSPRSPASTQSIPIRSPSGKSM
jgi:hypothetical protein